MKLLLCCAALLAVGCDSRAKASDPPKPERLSKELESCSSANDCEADLRCLEQVCQKTARSAVGDYYAALGAVKRAKNELEASVNAYGEAIGHYDSEKVKLPPEIDCAYGGALAAARDVKKEFGERGAKVLHRCVLAVPPGSHLRTQAMLDLALLDDAGIDPLALGRPQLGDVYLTKNAAPKKADTTYTMTATPPLPEKIQTPLAAALEAQKAAIFACFTTFSSMSKKDAMVVTINAKQSFYKNPDFEDDPGSVSMKLEPASSSLAGPEAGADACIRPILEGALKNGPKDTFKSAITITVK